MLKIRFWKRLVCGLSLSCVVPLAGADTPPNIIVIMADDLGWGDTGCYGAENVKTPNIDRLAAEGRRFTSGYCTASTCTPTRFTFMTGVHAFRQPGTGIASPNAGAIIKPGTPTIASLLRQGGYRTAVIGKWHLGLGDPAPDWNGLLKPGPLEIGFDHCFLLPTTNDRVPQVYVRDHKVLNLDPADPLWVGSEKPSDDHPTGITHRDTLKMDWSHGHNQTIHNGISRIGFYTGGHAARFRDEDLADEWVTRSVEWMETNRDNPFFLFFASHDIHVPRIPHERFQGATEMGFRGDCIVEFDWCVGEVLAAVERLGLRERTLIVLCSDNGPVLDDGYADGAVERLYSHRPAGPFDGGKYSVLEGGTRIPFIVWGPGRVTPGVSDEMVTTGDLAASFAALAGVGVPEGACRDSQNLMPALLGREGAKGRDHLLQQDNGLSGNFGLRVGDWKLVRTAKRWKPSAKVSAPPRESPPMGDTLYYLPDDPAERKDRSKDEPERLKSMAELLDKLTAS
jgi:arylsulfatase A-like enzyme